MGDYSKLIVTCQVKVEAKELLEEEIKKLGLLTSAYQSQEFIISVQPSSRYSKEGKALDVILVGQTKYGRGQDEFCKFLKPYVMQGSGKNDVYAVSFSEYGDNPQIWKLDTQDDY